MDGVFFLVTNTLGLVEAKFFLFSAFQAFLLVQLKESKEHRILRGLEGRSGDGESESSM